MQLETIINYHDSVNYIKSKFTINYSKFIEDFSNFKFNNAEYISFFKIDDYIITNISSIYNYNDFILWSKLNNIKVIEFDISSYISH